MFVRPLFCVKKHCRDFEMDSSVMDEIVGRDRDAGKDPRFPHAPAGWTQAAAVETARQAGIEPGEEHWDAVRGLQEFYARQQGSTINLRALHDALDEKFHRQGGIRRLYQLFPGGPVAQGCLIAGLKAPAGAIDKGFGSVG